MLQVEKIKALMPMEIHLTSQRSCSISHGTQLRIPSHVLLEIACICIMRRECPTENLLFFWFAPREGPGPFNCNQRWCRTLSSVLPSGPRRGRWCPHDQPCCYANGRRPCWFFNTCVNYNSDHGKFWSKDAIVTAARVDVWRCRWKINSTFMDWSKSALQWMYDWLPFTCNAT